jgi:hypothetical protein
MILRGFRRHQSPRKMQTCCLPRFSRRDTVFGLNSRETHSRSQILIHFPLIRNDANTRPRTYGYENALSTKPTAAEPPYRYRLFPDWQTSYLWYDDHEPLPWSGQAHVDMNVIEERYPSLARYYFEWLSSGSRGERKGSQTELRQ